MKLIVGLGNPGEKYKDNRHNIGFVVLDKLIEIIQNSKLKTKSYNLELKTQNKFEAKVLRVENVLFAETQTFMNKSGVAVSKISSFYKIVPNDLYVIHDDLDIRLGEYKIQFGVGPKLHYGIQSIEEELGIKDFWRVRVGVDYRDPDNRTLGEDYVLQDFREDEIKLRDRVINEIISELIYRLKDSR